ncbi:MAG: prepilin-type N-terminal cleavage/methylation domain-containing protein [Deltaproteobacteria bacterium]|nr:prepilin-type N-terminal cleavage/methylation domain-containing protein [Deltaproteobacteria bacterium]
MKPFVFSKSEKKEKGFTLLEVIVSLVILAVALLGFHQGQTSSVRLSLRSEKLAQATALAQQKMTETELQLRKKNLASFQEEEKGEFTEEAFKEFKWNRKFEKITLSCFLPKPKTEVEGQQGYYAIAEKYFENSMRKIKVTIEWQEGNKTRSTHLTQLYVDFPNITIQ